MNGLTLVALIAIALAAIVGYRIGVARERSRIAAPPPEPPATHRVSTPTAAPSDLPQADDAREGVAGAVERLNEERARLVRSYAEDADRLRAALASSEAELRELRKLAAEHRHLAATEAALRADVARYRQIVIDLENNAPPPLLESPTAPDDLKLIVGVGPVLERMLQTLGISTYRQIARWSERDIDDIEARLPEFPGRIRRDDWVTQARALHQSKYGVSAGPKERS